MSQAPPIVVALSGGVDSATAAAMLVEAGRRVVGITMRLFDASGTSVSAGGRCCGPRDVEDARRVCEHLGIPFYVVDFERSFIADVVDDFVDAYLRGDTPNPCVRCNQYIKFTPLLARARALGAEQLVTGHYARIDRDAAGRLRLRRGMDANKDQSYFLFSMPIDELAAVQFPLGALTKDEVRTRAAAYNLPNADKRESQEICFVPDGDYAGFVEQAARARGEPLPASGEIVDQAGAVVGRHTGIHRYTIGQRRGLGSVSVNGLPVYVSSIEPRANRIVVGPRSAAATATLEVGDVRWFEPPPLERLTTTVQIRHRHTPVPAQVRWDGSIAHVHFTGEPVVASPGQAAVFYDGDVVLGGGWIRAREPGAQ